MADNKLRMTGLILILIGCLYLVDDYLHLGDISGPLFLLAVSGGFIWGWSRNSSTGLLIAASCTGALGVFALADEVINLGDWGGTLFFLTQAGAFYVVHRLDAVKPTWARNTAYGLAGFAVFIAMAEGSDIVGKILLPAALILVGVWMASGKRR